MKKPKKQGRSRDRSAADLPVDLIVWEILLRLPAKDLLRCQAVCRAWRRHASAADFLLAHHRRQPSLHILTDDEGAFDAVDLRRRPAERHPVLRIKDHRTTDEFDLHASCDGLILLSLSNSIRLSKPSIGRFYICNPTTRQWMTLPRLRGVTNSDIAMVSGMYSHSPTGEYRVLYWKRAPRPSVPADTAVYYVLTVGPSARPWCIGQPIASPATRHLVEQGLVSTSISVNFGPPLLLHHNLYWICPWVGQKEGIVVFDTIRESFSSMCFPTGAIQLANYDDYWILLEIDDTLAISWKSDNKPLLKLWVLRDYETEAWSLKYQIDFSVAEISPRVETTWFQGIVVSAPEDGDALIFNSRKHKLFHLNNKGKLLQTLECDDTILCPTGLVFKVNLLRHAFFEGPREGVPSREPQFFVGL